MIKPILFNTKMVRAIQDDRKTATRRLIKPQPDATFPYCHEEHTGWHWTTSDGDDDMMGWWPSFEKGVKPPYQPGDILYVRETWGWNYCYDCGMADGGLDIVALNDGHIDNDPFRCDDETAERVFFEKEKEYGCYCYKASAEDDEIPDGDGRWHPSIHMPKKAARLFLRVTGVRVEKLQDITPADAVYEGAYEDCRECLDTYGSTGKQCCYRDEDECSQCESVIESFAEVWNNCYASPQPVKENGKIVRYESYPWEDIRETRTYRGLPWLVIGNPWIWVVEFERISKEEALKNE